jgi:hypothetical protein
MENETAPVTATQKSNKTTTDDYSTSNDKDGDNDEVDGKDL